MRQLFVRSRFLPGAVVVLVAAAGLLPTAGAEAREGYPRTMNVYLINQPSPAQIEILSRFDVLALDVDFPKDNPGAFEYFRSVNPDIVLLGFIPVNGVVIEAQYYATDRTHYKYFQKLEANNWWLRDTQGGIIADWPTKGSANLTEDCPRVQGQTFADWFPQFVGEEVWKNGTSGWDGLFLDDVWATINWLNTVVEYPIDADGNGVPDAGPTLDAKWDAGNELIVQRVRQLVGPDAILIGNGPTDYYSDLNGVMVEDFPYEGPVDQDNIHYYAWNHWMFNRSGAYMLALDNFLSAPGPITTINSGGPGTRDEPDRTAYFERHKRFTLASALLGDGYYSLDEGWSDHASTWWEPEYDIYLGDPLGDAYTVDNNGVTIWRRDYEAAIVVVNPNNALSGATEQMPNVFGWDAYIGPRRDLVDTTAPEAVTDLVQAAPGTRSVEVTWTQPHDEGAGGGVASYHVRYNTEPIVTGFPWIEATPVANTIVPGRQGDRHTLEIPGLEPGRTYYVAVRALDHSGNIGSLGPSAEVTTDLEGGDEDAPSKWVRKIGLPSPNPARTQVSIHLNLAQRTPVHLEVYDLAGRRVYENRFERGAGEGEIGWDRRDERGRPVSPGLYFLRVRAGGTEVTRKLQVLGNGG